MTKTWRLMLFAIAALIPSGAAMAGGWAVDEPAYPTWSPPPLVIVVEGRSQRFYGPYPAFLYPYPRFRPVIYNHPPHFLLYAIDVARPHPRRRVLHRHFAAPIRPKWRCSRHLRRHAW